MKKPNREPDYIYDYKGKHDHEEHFWIHEKICCSYRFGEWFSTGKWRMECNIHGGFDLEYHYSNTNSDYWQKFDTDNSIMVNRLIMIADDVHITKALEDALWAKEKV